MSDRIKAFCRNPRHKRPPVVGWYTFSESDNEWERTDDGGSDRDFWFSHGDDGQLQMHARPTFTCACGRETEYNHDKIQSMIEDAISTGDRLWVL